MVKIAFSKIKTSKIQHFQSERCLSIPFVVNPSRHWLSSIGESFGCPGFFVDVPAFPASRHWLSSIGESFGCPGFFLPDDDSEVKNYFNTGIF